MIAAEAESQKLQVLLAELVQDCQKRSPEAAGDKSIAGHLLRLRDAKGQPLSFRRMVQEFFIFFLAGSETTGHTIAWTLCAPSHANCRLRSVSICMGHSV